MRSSTLCLVASSVRRLCCSTRNSLSWPEVKVSVCLLSFIRYESCSQACAKQSRVVGRALKAHKYTRNNQYFLLRRAGGASLCGHSPWETAQHLFEKGGGTLGHIWVKSRRVKLRHQDFGFNLMRVFILEGQSTTKPGDKQEANALRESESVITTFKNVT